jgi:hypothetical protein
MNEWDKFFTRTDILGGVMEIHPKNRTGEESQTYRGTIQRIDRSTGRFVVELRNIQKLCTVNGQSVWTHTDERVPCTFEMSTLMGSHRPQLDYEGRGNWWIIFPAKG